MSKIVKVLMWIGGVIGIIVIALITYVQLAWDKKFEAPYPKIIASKDSAVIARGKHLAEGPAHCISCHVPMDKVKVVENGALMPLSGGWEMTIPPGTFRAPNLTPDKETGIGTMTDGEIARTLRYSVNNKNGCVFPFMPFQELSDEDLTAIVSYLRAQEPVKHYVPRTEYSFLGKILFAFGLFKPEGPKKTPPKSVPIDSSIAYGSYLAFSVANCYGCHTNRDLKTGEFIGEPFAGGLVFVPDVFTEGATFVTPNLTPDKKTGIMANWNETMFINRMKGGRIHKGTPMPWALFARMDDVELKALYRYLRSIKPVSNKIDQIVYAPGEEMK
jgi:mono/diheme cytochrome c family protein